MNLLPFLGVRNGVSARGLPLLERRRRLHGAAQGRFKIVFAEQRNRASRSGANPCHPRIPKFFDLRADPFERDDESDSTTPNGSPTTTS